MSSLWQYREFLQSAPEGIREVTHGLVRSFVLPGRGAGLALEDYSVRRTEVDSNSAVLITQISADPRCSDDILIGFCFGLLAAVCVRSERVCQD